MNDVVLNQLHNRLATNIIENISNNSLINNQPIMAFYR